MSQFDWGSEFESMSAIHWKSVIGMVSSTGTGSALEFESVFESVSVTAMMT